jgi:tetratricopeptide (TPR) repeat protein
MSTKSWLKRAKEYIGEKDFDQALDTCKQILQWEPENYTALVFLGLTYLNLKKEELAENAYTKATELNPQQPLAWQGLCNLYTSTGSFQNLTQTYTKLLNVYNEAGQGPKVLEVIEKLLQIYANEYVDSEAYMNTLMLQLPESPLYPSIKDLPNLPSELEVLHKMKTYQESYDEKTIQKLYDSRRRRLTSDSLETIKTKVIIEVLEKSKLEDVYDRFFRINDKLSESENLEITQNYLSFLYRCISYNIPVDLPERFNKLMELTNYCLSTQSPYFLPYQISLEYDNVNDVSEYNQSTIDYALTLEDSSDFYNYLKAYNEAQLNPGQIDIDNLLKYKNSLNTSIFYLHTMSYLTQSQDLFDECQFFTSKLTEKVHKLSSETQYNLDKVWESSQLTKANTYLKMEPKFHQLAYPIFIKIIENSPSNIRALEGLSNYLMESNQFELALEHLNKGLELDPQNSLLLCTLGWVYFSKKDYNLAVENLQRSIQLNPNEALVYYRLGRVYWEMGGKYGSEREFAMSQWILAAKLNPLSSDTFLYLGRYYLLIESDSQRAKKCFQKAISLKSSNLDAIKELYDLSLIDGELEFSQGLVLLATQSVPQSSWGWLKLGFLQLNSKQYSDAISSFHSGLRLDNKQSILWEGLGEAYYFEGRFMASLKAFERGLALNPNAYACSFYLAQINIKLGNYETSIVSLTNLLDQLNTEANPENLSIYQLPLIKSILNCYNNLAREEFSKGLYGKLVETLEKAFNLLQQVLTTNSNLELNWELAADLLIILRLVVNYITPNIINFCKFLTVKIQELIQLNGLHISEEFLFELDVIENLVQKSTYSQLDLIQICMLTANICYRYILQIYQGQLTPEFLSFYLYKISFAYASAHFFQEVNLNQTSNYLELASKTIQLALKYNSDSHQNWNLLGLINMKLNAKLSRESFNQSILRNPKNHITYTNMGYLCLMQMDYDLANQMFIHSQRLSPEYASAWLGQTLVAKSIKSTDLMELVTHAFNINEGQSTQIYLEFSELILANQRPPELLSLDQLNSGLFAMSKYCELIQNKPIAYNLLSIFQERLGMLEKAGIVLEIAIQQLNLDKSKKPLSITVNSMVNYARILCSLGRFEESIKIYLEAEALNLKRKDSEVTSVQARSYLGLGLAYFYVGDLDNSFNQFDHALTLSTGDPILITDTRLLLAQVLWALDRKQVAKEQLLECIRSNNQTLPILFGLCAMGILDQDATLTSAALDEISKTGLENRKKDYYGQLEYLTACGNLIKSEFNLAKTSLTKAIYLYPQNPFHWGRLAAFLNKVYPQLAYYTVTLMERALDNATKLDGITPREKSYLYQIQAESYLLLGEFKWAKLSSQKSLFILPTNLQSRRILATSIIYLNKENIKGNLSVINTVKNLLSTEAISIENGSEKELIGKFEGFSYSLGNLVDWDNNILAMVQ